MQKVAVEARWALAIDARKGRDTKIAEIRVRTARQAEAQLQAELDRHPELKDEDLLRQLAPTRRERLACWLRRRRVR